MTAFEQIRKSLEMTALIRGAVTGDSEQVLLKDGLTIEEYALFKKMYINEPYSTIRQMNDFMGRMRHNYDVMERHVDACLELGCLVEEDNLMDNIECGDKIMCGIPGFISQGYTALWNNWKDTGRNSEKVTVDKRSIRGTLKIAKLFAIGNKGEDRQALDEVAGFLHATLKYDKNFTDNLAKESRDNSVVINIYEQEGKAVCRQHALFTQLALQEAGIPVRQVIGILKDAKEQVPHMWNIASIDDRNVFIDAANSAFPLYGEILGICYAYLASRGRQYITAPRSAHFYKYSTRGLRCEQ